MIGKTLSHFRITAKLGEGGMGVVYRAEDERLRRPVALKVLPPDLVGNEERRLRFLREARAAAAVTHPSIATIYEVGEADGVVFIAMELVEGRTLRTLVAGRPLPVKDALRIAIDIAAGLAYAHQAHVIHRDLKPDNIVVGTSGQVKILDFGLAKLLEERGGAGDRGASRLQTISDEMTREGKVFGTVAYMSPEQARGEVVDTRSDIFSFGITLYEMLTGAAPFRGRTPMDILSAIIKEPAAPVVEANPEVPPDLERVLAKCLEKDPEDRYHHADEVVTDLRRLKRQTDSGVQAVRPAARGGRARQWDVAAAVAVALAGTAGILVALNIGGWRDRLLRGSARGRISSLAVLPLVNLARDPEQEYFTDGMTEELISGLAKIRTLRVISRTSVIRFKGTNKPMSEIARELGVDAVVEGTVRRAGDRVRITVQLIEASTDQHLWADSYEGDLQDVLTLQSRVALAITAEIRETLTPEERTRLDKRPTTSPEAHEAYLKGLYSWNKRTKEGFIKASELFQEAIRKDPNYALAYAGLADTYELMAEYQYLPTAEGLLKAKAAALKALEIDDSLAEAHTSLAAILQLKWDWEAGEREFRRAIELNPNYATAQFWYGYYLKLVGRFDESLLHTKRALELDPLSFIIRMNLADVYFRSGDLERALTQARQAVELDPGRALPHRMLGAVYSMRGMTDEAIVELEKAHALNPEFTGVIGDLGYLYAVAGRRTDALTLLEELKQKVNRGEIASVDIATIYLGLGERSGIYDWLEKAYEERIYQLVELRSHPWFAPLRSDPRFKDLVRRVGLTPD